MSTFKLRDLGEKLRVGLDKISPGTTDINWNLENYNLKSNCVTGALTIMVKEVDSTQHFSRMKTVLLLSDLNVDMKRMHYNPDTDIPGISEIVLETSISLDDFPEIALTNYIKDSQETLNYVWNIEDKEQGRCY